MKILLLSAYDTASHKAWRQGLVSYFSDVDWTQLLLEPRYFNWRIRGNSFCWAFGQRSTLARTYDLIIATSMVDLASLRGMVPELSRCPAIVYFHENQFAYPNRTEQVNSLEPQLVNFYSALCANLILFNSEYNKNSFLDGLTQLLKKLPDHVPPDIPKYLNDKSQVLPVPITDEISFWPKSKASPKSTGFSVVWNHRWEYDKGPDRLLACILAIPREIQIQFHIIGQSFRSQPKEFDQIRSLLAERNWLGEWGYIPNKSDYYRLLSTADAVLSNAIHDFQGLAILEAVAMGCWPIVPNRLSYRELFPENFRYASFLDDVKAEGKVCASAILDAKNKVNKKTVQLLAESISINFAWSTLGPRYRAIITNLTASST